MTPQQCLTPFKNQVGTWDQITIAELINLYANIKSGRISLKFFGNSIKFVLFCICSFNFSYLIGLLPLGRIIKQTARIKEYALLKGISSRKIFISDNDTNILHNVTYTRSSQLANVV